MKFENAADEYIYRTTLDGCVTGAGDVDGPFGWFAGVDLVLDLRREVEVREHYGTPYLILFEDTQGLVSVQGFPDVKSRDRRLLELERGHAMWEAEISDEDMREAIDNYLQAALFTASDEHGNALDDGSAMSWSEETQRTAADDVIEFILENIDDVREFLDIGNMTWAQVGIDFSLTRNHHGAGFWDRGAGAVGGRLTEAAHAWGGAEVYLGDNGELEIA